MTLLRRQVPHTSQQRLALRALSATGKLLALGLLAAFIALLVLAGCTDREVPTTKPQPVLTYWVSAGGVSMLPTFPERALVEVQSVPFDALRAGDTVIFWDYTERTGATFVHHRLVQLQGAAWIARGDNKLTNSRADAPWVTRDNYIGRTTGRHTQILTAR